MVSELFPPRDFKTLEDKSLYMQLYRAAGTVYALKEAMWDELRERIESREREDEREELTALHGWEDSDFSVDASRKIFDRLVERYKE